MSFECVLYEKKEGIAVITLNRPQVLNAMNKQLWLDIRRALQDAGDDDTIKVVIFTGQGRAFSTGADLKESKGRSLKAYRDYLVYLQEISREIIRFAKPTIAAINGYALGSGYELALACDIRIASETAKLGSPEARVSSSVTGGAMRLVQHLVGPGKARELLFTCEYIDGREAERIGLVNKAVAPERLMEEAMAMAGKIAENSLFSIRLIKKGLNMAYEVSLDALMDYEIEACLATVSAPERQEKLEEFSGRKKGSA
ncbi:MAG: enoyl-CoA hydratase/isomerase family protein [Desulfobacteraceae bacterium]|nr:MAG: enoyl-CoA hydratase/isomerase family protein [Desulfobacteraceae bacterium]